MSLTSVEKRIETLLEATKPGSEVSDSKLLAMAFGFDHKLMARLPIDINGIALGLRHPRISSIRSVRLPVDGMLVPNKDKLAILVNKNQPIERQRFSCAHELVHAYSDPSQPARRQLPFPSITPAERNCEKLASVLLMPNPAFRDYVNQYGHSISAIVKLHYVFQTSIQATAIRFVDTIKRHCILIVSRIGYAKSGRRLRVKWSSQNSDRILNSSRPFIPTNASLNMPSALIAYKTPGTQSSQELCSIGRLTFGGYTESRGFGKGDRRYVLTLIYPDGRPA
jgi:hypothetical protein